MQVCTWIQLVGALAATCVGLVAGNLSDRCPALDSDPGGNCVEQCSSDADCENYQACCSNGCGHACVNVTRPPGIGPKQQCPPLDRESLGPCVEECTSDSQCEAGQVCCSNGCGHSCTKPLELSLKPGRCPEVDNRTNSVGVCAEECSGDGDCPGSQKCCSNGCGHVCTETDQADATEGPQVHAGSCPEIAEGSVGVCSEECSSDEDCNGDQKCCSNGCGHVCKDPTMKVPSEPKPGYCPVPTASSMGVCSEECSSDEDCTGDQKCCSNDCGHVCMPITTDQIPQNDGCRLGENFYLEGEIIPSEECNECRCSVGEVKCTVKDDCQEKVPFVNAVMMPAVFCSVGIVMTCALLLIFARCFLFKPVSRRSRYKLMHEIPEFEPDVGEAMKNGNVL